MPLGMEIGLGPGDIVLDGDPAPPKRGAQPIQCLLWPNGWMDLDETWHAGGPWLSSLVLDGYSAPPPTRGTACNFWPVSVLAKRLDGSRCHLVWR